MSIYDAALNNISEICETFIDDINKRGYTILDETPTKNSPRIITSMDDAKECVNRTKEELLRFKTVVSPEDIYKLLNIRIWKLNVHKAFECEIQAIDLRHTIVYYKIIGNDETIEYEKRCEKISDFLDAFCP